MSKQHVGSNFDDFLKQEGLLAECEAEAFKRTSLRRKLHSTKADNQDDATGFIRLNGLRLKPAAKAQKK